MCRFLSDKMARMIQFRHVSNDYNAQWSWMGCAITSPRKSSANLFDKDYNWIQSIYTCYNHRNVSDAAKIFTMAMSNAHKKKTSAIRIKRITKFIQYCEFIAWICEFIAWIAR
eukprot:965498_1